MSNIENQSIEVESSASDPIKTRQCVKCLLHIDVKTFCPSSRSKCCGKCLYQKKKAYMQKYYKDHREAIIEHEMEKYNAIHAGLEKKKAGRKRKPIIINSEL